jgi:xylulokinase
MNALPADPLLMGIDLGTSSVKVVAVTLTGTVVGTGSAEYPILSPQSGLAEQQPEAWWQATVHAVKTATSEPGVASQIVAIGLSGQMHGLVTLDHSEALVGNAIIWPDQRSSVQVRDLTARVGAENLIRIAGSPLATGFAAASLAWLRVEQPQVFNAIANILSPKDYLRWRLTGELAGDPSDGSGALLLDVTRRTWSPELLDVVGVDRATMSPLRPSSAPAGALTHNAASALGLPPATPVATGAADTACGMLGAGVTDPQTLIVNLSTGGQLVLPVLAPKVDLKGRIHTFCSALEPSSGAAAWYHMGATLNVGLAMRWLRDRVLGWSGDDAYDRMTAAAAEVGPGANGLIFLPWLVGERTPHMDSALRASFVGLSLRHGPGHLVRALLEGTTFACLDALRVLQEVSGHPDQVVLAGGGSRSPLWQQIVADIFGVEVRRLLVAEQSAMGAALLAGASVSMLDLLVSTHSWAAKGPPIAPRRSEHEKYAHLEDLFHKALVANRDLFHELGDLDHKDLE